MKITAQNKNQQSNLVRSSVKGFTLIEVIVVMAIIVSLAGIGFGVFFKMNRSAKESETRILLNQISDAMISRSADISSDQRTTVGVQTGFTFPTGNGGSSSSADLVDYIAGDYDGDGETDIGAVSKLEDFLPQESGKSSYLNEDGEIVDSWNTPIRYTFPGVYHTEDDGFDLESAGPDREFSGTNSDGKDAKLDNIILK